SIDEGGDQGGQAEEGERLGQIGELTEVFGRDVLHAHVMIERVDALEVTPDRVRVDRERESLAILRGPQLHGPDRQHREEEDRRQAQSRGHDQAALGGLESIDQIVHGSSPAYRCAMSWATSATRAGSGLCTAATRAPRAPTTTYPCISWCSALQKFEQEKGWTAAFSSFQCMAWFAPGSSCMLPPSHSMPEPQRM